MYRKKQQDKINEIQSLVGSFRKAIDIAKANDEFRRLAPFYKFPDDCCEHVCDLLVQYLAENGIETHQVNGTCKYDESWHHVWLETNDKTIIDITEDQFIGKIRQLKTNPRPVHVGTPGEIQEIFSVNNYQQETTIFTDENEFTCFGGQPNARQKRLTDLYEIIYRYL